MGLSIQLQQIAKKASGIYFLERSVDNVTAVADLDGYRLLIGQSKQGVTNKIVRVDSWSEFKTLFGNVDRRMERRGSFFHRAAYYMLQQGSIKVINIREYDDVLDLVSEAGLRTSFKSNNNDFGTAPYTKFFNTSRNWFVDLESLVPTANASLLRLVNIGEKDLSVYVRPLKSIEYTQTVKEYFDTLGVPSPEYLEESMMINDTFVEVFVFNKNFKNGIPNSIKYLFNSDLTKIGTVKNTIIDANGIERDALGVLINEDESNFIGLYQGSLIPTLTDFSGNTLAIDNLVNAESDLSGLIARIDVDMLDVASDFEPLSEEDLFDAPNVTNHKRPLVIDFTASQKYEYAGTTLGNVSATPGEFLSIKNDSPSIKIFNGLTQNPDHIIEGHLNQRMVGLPYNNPAIAIQNVRPMLHGLEVEDTVNGVFTYQVVPFGEVVINGKGYEASKSMVVSDLSGFQVGDLFIANDSNTTRLINLDFVGSRLEIVGIHTEKFPLDATGQLLGTWDAATSQWLYAGGASAGAPIEYNYGVNMADPEFGFPLDQVGGAVIPFPSISDVDLANLVSNNPTYAQEVNYFVAEFDRILYRGNDLSETFIQFSSNENENVVTLTNGTRLVVAREKNGQGARMTIKLERLVDTHEFQQIEMKGFRARDEQFVNGTSTRLEDILNSTMLGTIRDLLEDNDYEKFNYLIDSFESFPTSNIKSQFGVISTNRKLCTAIVNMPFVKKFKDSTNPYFKDSATDSKVRVEYISKGGNKNLPSTQAFSLPTKQQGSDSVCTFFPNCTVIENGTSIRFPISPIVSNLFAQKWVDGTPYKPVFGSVIAGSSIGRLGMELNDDDRAYLERMGVNPIDQELKILGNETVLSDGTALSNLHVRETINVLSEELKPIAKSFLGQFNTDTTRAIVKARVDRVLERYLNNGALTYARSIVDTSNNTDELITKGIGLIDVEIVVSNIAKKVVIRTTAYNSTSEIGVGIIL